MGYPTERDFEDYRSNRGGTVKRTYRDNVMRTCPNFGTDTLEQKLNLGALGLAGEAGEVVDLIKKVLHHGTPLDKEKLVKEMGDVCWYLEYLAASIGVEMEDIEAANVAKLMARYPDGFSHAAANARRDAPKEPTHDS